MFITALLIICAILFIIAMLHLTDKPYTKDNCKKYQEHIDDLVTELFPPSSIPDSTLQTPAVQAPTPNESYYPQEDPQYQETKRKMVANIRTYFSLRKINATLAKVQASEDFVSVNQSSGYDDLSFPTPPSIERLME